MSTQIIKTLSREGLPIFFCESRVYSGKPFHISEQSLLYFSGGDKSLPNFPKVTIHTNLQEANDYGLPDRIAAGAMFEGLIAELISNIVGDVWYKIGKMRLKFIQPVFIGDSVTPYVSFNQVVDGKAMFDIWCENQDKVKTIVGQAIV